MDYLSAKEVAEKWDISRRRVQVFVKKAGLKGI